MISLWRVDNAMTRQLMSLYHRKLAAGVGRAEALRQVQLELLASKKWSQPHHWASFIVSGDPSPLPERVAHAIPPVQRGARGCSCEVSPGQRPAWPGAVMLTVLVLGAAVLTRRRRTMSKCSNQASA